MTAMKCVGMTWQIQILHSEANVRSDTKSHENDRPERSLPTHGYLRIHPIYLIVSSESTNPDMSEARLPLYPSQASSMAGIYSRKPQRITITVPWSTYQALLEISDEQGRSLSNTAAYWLERQSDAMSRQRA